MSDSGLRTEQWLLANAPSELPCDLIVMGRHVSGFSGDFEFLRAAHPRALIATAAPFPSAERIRPAWADTVRSLDIDLFRQDETGAATVTVGADSFTLTPYLSASNPPRTFSHATDSFR